MKNKPLTLLLLLAICSPLYSQNYQSEKDSLLLLKNSITTENTNLKSDIDSLTAYLSNLEKELNAKQNELKGLKRKLYAKKYGKKIAARIALCRIWKGMTIEMLEDGWGKPDRTHTDKHSWGVFTQLYYGDITYFFKNSILTDWEESSKKIR